MHEKQLVYIEHTGFKVSYRFPKSSRFWIVGIKMLKPVWLTKLSGIFTEYQPMEPLRHIKTGNAKGQISIKSTSTTALECVVDSWSSKEITSLLHKHAKCSSYKVPTTSLKQLSTQERSRVTRDHSPVLLSPKVNLVPGHPPRQPVSAHLRPLQRPCCWP